MRHIILTMILAIAGFTTAGAQTFLQHLQQRQQGQGMVTVNESRGIDSLVNNILPPVSERKTDKPSKKDNEKISDKDKHDSAKNRRPTRM